MKSAPKETLMGYILMLRNKGITDARVLNALERIPRHEFVSENFRDRAYEDTALPTGAGQTLSQPSIVAKMTQALDVSPRDKVLEIGTGTGFQAAILCQLARRIYTIERYSELAKNAEKTFERLRLPNITVIRGDGTEGLQAQAPFDRIILTAAAEDPPANLLEQLKENGIMVLPVGQSNATQTLIKITKTSDGLDYEELEEVRFVPLVAGKA